jgi:hypothetical protein
MEPVSDDVLRNIMSAKDETCLAVYGRVTYTETFGEKRFTNFSSVILRNPSTNTWHWIRTQPHNDSN